MRYLAIRWPVATTTTSTDWRTGSFLHCRLIDLTAAAAAAAVQLPPPPPLLCASVMQNNSKETAARKYSQQGQTLQLNVCLTLGRGHSERLCLREWKDKKETRQDKEKAKIRK